MAFPTAVNDQVTDAVTQSNVQVLSVSASEAMGNLFQAAAASASQALQNAVSQQQQNNVLAQAVTTACVNSLEK